MTSLLVALLIFFDSIAGMLAGFGTSIFLIPILLLWYPLHTSLILASVLHLLNNSQRTFMLFSAITWRTVLIFGIPAAFFSIIGAQLTFVLSPTVITRVLALLILVYVGSALFNHLPTLPQAPAISAGMGSVYGLLEGFTGIGGPVRVIALSQPTYSPTSFIATNSAIALFVDLTRLGTYLSHSLPRVFGWQHYIFFLIITLAGSFVGKIILNHIPEICFRFIIYAALVLTAIKLLLVP